MDVAYCLHELTHNARVIETLAASFNDDQARWRPHEMEWSALEVICHLRDEEREDFPFRIRHLLSGAVEKWPPILPAKWVLERAYNDDDLRQVLADFLAERARNLDWLAALENPNWQARYAYEPLEGLSAGDLLAAWTVHDLLHIRQLNELKYKYGEYGPLSGRMIAYAGEW
ncbi:MAG: DinB family protein [Anaerolineales bacterium]